MAGHSDFARMTPACFFEHPALMFEQLDGITNFHFAIEGSTKFHHAALALRLQRRREDFL
jgi:hypothetical protein